MTGDHVSIEKWANWRFLNIADALNGHRAAFAKWTALGADLNDRRRRQLRRLGFADLLEPAAPHLRDRVQEQ